jgi:maltose O-acetyltransferase
MRRCQVVVGPGTVINSGCRFTPGQVTIGANSFVGFGCTFDATAPISIGDGVDIALNVQLITFGHKLAGSDRRAGVPCPRPITIESGCWLGASVHVLPGITIGRGCVIGTGAVVTRDCAPNGLYAGVPARRIRDLA